MIVGEVMEKAIIIDDFVGEAGNFRMKDTRNIQAGIIGYTFEIQE